MPIGAAKAADESAIRQLLEDCGLPTDDLTVELLGNFLVQRDGAQVVAVGGLELLGRDALLRSVAVAPAYRGADMGVRMVRALEAVGQQEGCRRLYLLTTTAAGFFDRLGYRRIAREAAPPQVRATRQYSALCPSSSTLMVKTLEAR